MKVTKSQLKSWVREVINEIADDADEEEPSHLDATDIEDNPFDKDEVEEASYRMVSGKKMDIPQPSDFGGDMEKYFKALNKHMKTVEKEMKKQKKSKKESVKESLVKEGTRRIFVKEIQKWMKTLEENRYRKLVNADARRVAWFVNNNMSESYDDMPDSLRKKWDKAAYGKERYLAREFIKHKKNEQKLRESIRYIINTKLRG